MGEVARTATPLTRAEMAALFVPAYVERFGVKPGLANWLFYAPPATLATLTPLVVDLDGARALP